MTCAQGLLRLLWGGPEVGVLRDWLPVYEKLNHEQLERLKLSFFVSLSGPTFEKMAKMSIF